MDWMISSDLVIWHALILAWILVIKEVIVELLFERSEICSILLSYVSTATASWHGSRSVLTLIHKSVFAIAWLIINAHLWNRFGPTSNSFLLFLVSLFLFLLSLALFLLLVFDGILVIHLLFGCLLRQWSILIDVIGYTGTAIQLNLAVLIFWVFWVLFMGSWRVKEDDWGAFFLWAVLSILLIILFLRWAGFITNCTYNGSHRALRGLHKVISFIDGGWSINSFARIFLHEVLL